MKNRESLYPGRVKLTPVDAANGIYDLIRADEPQEPGTPLNKKLLDFAVAACGVTAGTATAYTLDDEFGGFELVNGAKVNFQLHVASGFNPTLNVNGTGAKPIVNAAGSPLPAGIPEWAWMDARYDASKDAFIAQYSGGDVRVVTNTILTAAASSVTIEIPRGCKRLHVAMVAIPSSDTNTGITASITGCSGGSGNTHVRQYTGGGSGNYGTPTIQSKFAEANGATFCNYLNIGYDAKIDIDVIIGDTKVAAAIRAGGGYNKAYSGESGSVMNKNQDNLTLVISAGNFVAGTAVFAEAVMV